MGAGCAVGNHFAEATPLVMVTPRPFHLSTAENLKLLSKTSNGNGVVAGAPGAVSEVFKMDRRGSEPRENEELRPLSSNGFSFFSVGAKGGFYRACFDDFVWRPKPHL